MKIESNKNWTTCLRLNTGDGSPRVFLLNSHFLGSVPSKEPIMNKKAVPDNLSESEREELVRLRERNAYLEAEIAVIKK